MSFKKNLLQKINIDKMAKQVIASIGPPESGRKVDKKTMRSLLEMASYTYRRKRDLDLFIEDVDAEKTRILVLDNDLAIYNTTVYDVAMRKTPTVKEMMNPFNVIKILKDTDVVISKKEESVKTIQKECIDRLDLSYDESDLDEIAKDGTASLEREYADGVIESIDLFAEILGYSAPPKPFRIAHHKIVGALIKKQTGEIQFGPMVLYSIIHNALKLIETQTGSFDKERLEFIQKVASGKEPASSEGPLVFEYLKKTALLQRRVP
jgi:tRNA uridine 5-carbamoylmethylation protein Kti12